MRALYARLVFTATACVVFLSPLAGLADEKYVKGEQPAFREVQPGRALVYFVRPTKAPVLGGVTFEVLIDDTPGGYLTGNSCLVAQLEPGRRLVWGLSRKESQWFDFEAGRTYLLLLQETYDARNAFLRAHWASGDPADVRGIVLGRKLSTITPTEEGRARLRRKAEKEYDEVRRKAPEAMAAVTLPATYQTVWYRPGKRGFSLKAYEATGTLTVDKEAIEFRSDEKTITIPVKDVQSLSLDKITSGFLGAADPNEWGIVKYVTSAGATEVAAFRDGRKLGHGGHTERIYSAFKSAVQPAEFPVSPPSAEARSVPEGFVAYEGFKDQFGLAIPQEWTAYDQARLFKGAPGKFGVVLFLPASSAEELRRQRDPGSEPGQAAGILGKVATGEIASFFVDRVPAGEGMSCAGFSPNAEKQVLKMVSNDPMFREEAKVLEPVRAEPSRVGSCKALRIRGRALTAGGGDWLIDLHAASDADTLYLFVLRVLAENHAKNTDVFKKVLSTAELAAAR